jgi:hypothetical protein
VLQNFPSVFVLFVPTARVRVLRVPMDKGFPYAIAL